MCTLHLGIVFHYKYRFSPLYSDCVFFPPVVLLLFSFLVFIWRRTIYYKNLTHWRQLNKFNGMKMLKFIRKCLNTPWNGSHENHILPYPPPPPSLPSNHSAKPFKIITYLRASENILFYFIHPFYGACITIYILYLFNFFPAEKVRCYHTQKTILPFS